MSEERMEECFALDLEDGEFPPGLWATSGRLGEEYEIYVGHEQQVQDFIPEWRIPEVIAGLEEQGERMLARLLRGIAPDVAELRAGAAEVGARPGRQETAPGLNYACNW
jgi:hypothetical protein